MSLRAHEVKKTCVLSNVHCGASWFALIWTLTMSATIISMLSLSSVVRTISCKRCDLDQCDGNFMIARRQRLIMVRMSGNACSCLQTNYLATSAEGGSGAVALPHRLHGGSVHVWEGGVEHDTTVERVDLA
jgi:hypothetical protein